MPLFLKKRTLMQQKLKLDEVAKKGSKLYDKKAFLQIKNLYFEK